MAESTRRHGKWKLAGLILLGIGAFLAFLAARAPADRIYALVEPRLPEGVALYGVRGSLWEGRATALDAAGVRLHGLTWEVHAADLLAGRLRLGLVVDDQHLELDGTVEREFDGTLRVAVARGRAAIPPLQGQTRWRHPRAEGEVFIRSLEATLADGGLQQADGRITWRDAAVTVAQRAELGDLELTLKTPEGGGTEGKVVDLGEGPLEADGTVSLSPAGRWQVDAVVEATEPESVLGRSLAMMAEEGDDGGYRLRYSGRITLPSF
ncbi:MAG: type II secretion system protein N [Pseudomonadota bacterium]